MRPILGEVRAFATEHIPPDGWLPCEGQLLSVAQHPMLFHVLRTTYGGDGRTTFALPDLRGRTPAGADVARPAGTRSGAAPIQDDGGMLPTLVVRWAIAVVGRHPSE